MNIHPRLRYAWFNKGLANIAFHCYLNKEHNHFKFHVDLFDVCSCNLYSTCTT